MIAAVLGLVALVLAAYAAVLRWRLGQARRRANRYLRTLAMAALDAELDARYCPTNQPYQPRRTDQ